GRRRSSRGGRGGGLLGRRLLRSLLCSRLLGSSLLRRRLLGSDLLGRGLLRRRLLGRGLLRCGLLRRSLFRGGLLGRSLLRSCHFDLLDQVAKTPRRIDSTQRFTARKSSPRGLPQYGERGLQLA